MTAQLEKIFTETYLNDSAAMIRYCTGKINNADAARDMVHDAFYRAWSYVCSGKTIDNFRAFVYRCLHNSIVDRYRWKWKLIPLEDLSEGYVEQWLRTVYGPHRSIQHKEVLQYVGQLNEKDRQTIHMRFMQGMLLEEIAEATDETRNVIGVRIHRAIRKIRKMIEDAEALPRTAARELPHECLDPDFLSQEYSCRNAAAFAAAQAKPGQPVWWICSSCGRYWRSSIRNRLAGAACTRCDSIQMLQAA